MITTASYYSSSRGGGAKKKKKQEEEPPYVAPPKVKVTAKSPSRRRKKTAEEDGGGVGVAVEKESSDPRADFRESMVQMVVEMGLCHWDDLRTMLRRLLALNRPRPPRRHPHRLRRGLRPARRPLAAGVRPSPALAES
uniref:Transcription repressor n=1 Tax=Oryza punctata TaxID=4537 RepID=A0A0E0MCM8_ORYPU